jgi:hypothetical protein
MKPLKIVMILVAAGLLPAAIIGVIAKSRSFEGVFEVALPKPKNPEAKIAALIAHRAELEATGKLTEQLRRQSDLGVEMEKLMQTGMVCRLTLKNGVASVENFPRPTSLPKSPPYMSYSIRGFGSDRKIHFEALPEMALQAMICPPDDFMIEGSDVVVSGDLKQRFSRVQ